MRSPAERRARGSVVVDVAIVAAAFVVGAVIDTVVTPATLLASFAVLLGAGAAVGLRGAPGRGPIAFGSAAGALLIYGWAVAREPPSDASAALTNGLVTAVAFALILGAAFVLPGYLFGRAFRRSRETAALVDGGAVTDRVRVPPGSGLRSDVGAGVLILLTVVAVILWIFRNPPLSP